MANLRLTIPSYGTATIVFRSKLASAIGYLHDGNLCLTPNASTICVETNAIARSALAHEWGHKMQAERRGWAYLPWVLAHYAAHGYVNSRPEREADAWAKEHIGAFAALPNFILEPTE